MLQSASDSTLVPLETLFNSKYAMYDRLGLSGAGYRAEMTIEIEPCDLLVSIRVYLDGTGMY